MDELERLRIEAQDERARRRWAERELAAEVDKKDLWRKRAEERTARIRLLEERLAARPPRQSPLDRIKSFVSKLLRSRPADIPQRDRQSAGVARPELVKIPASGPVTVPPHDRRDRAFSAVRCALLGGGDLAFVHEFDTVDLAVDADGLFDSDLVVVTSGALADASQSLRTAIVEWLDLPGRQPIVVWQNRDHESGTVVARIVESADQRLDARTFCPGFQRGATGPGNVEAEATDDVGLEIVTAAGLSVALVTGVEVSKSRILTLQAAGVPVLTEELRTRLAPRLRLSATEGNRIAAAVLEDRDLMLQLAVASRRRAWREQSPAVRAQALLDLLGISAPSRSWEIGVLLLSNKPHLVVPALEMVLAQRNVDIFPVVGVHGDPTDFSAVRERIEELLSGRPHEILEIAPDVTLGEAMNRAARACASPILAKMDDDDWYGPHYLEDALYSMQASGADVVGKARYLVELAGDEGVYLVDGPEEDFSGYTIGSSLVFRRRLWEDVPFPNRPSRIDSLFLRAARGVGASIYSNSRLEFAVRRRADGHTWQVEPEHFEARGRRVGGSLADLATSVPDELVPGLDL